MSPLVALVALATASFMAGVLWVIQIVHYPLLDEVPDSSIERVALRHQRLITRVVGPTMIVEAISSLWILLLVPESLFYLALASFTLLLIAVGVTIFQAVPLHSRIAQGTSHLIPRLIQINWPRTVAWSLRIPCGALLVYQTLN
ncbi:MAG: hypothetical protein ACJZ57_07125 [Candidatus Poriferisodalaceae bacterium]|nr:MAG: hypothetical protein CNE88_06185 [Acidimicrobiales bacterium MED-G01]